MNLRHLAFCFTLFAASAAFAPAQEPNTSPTSSPANSDDEVFKITTKLVQVDVVVTDGGGQPVTGLTQNDFEVRQDGKTQKIVGLTYVGGKGPTEVAPGKPEKNGVPAPPVKVRPSETSRIITFVVDDGNCLASRTGMRAAREGLDKFIREQMLANDLVAIYRTRAGSSMFQQYTSDKAQLLKAAKKVQWLPAMGTCGGSGDLYEAARSNTIDKVTQTGTQTRTIESDSDRKQRESTEDRARNSQVLGMAGVLRYIFRGLEHVPGRKMLFLISDGVTLWSRGREPLTVNEVLRPVTELANRASVVIHTIDPRGVFDPGTPSAEDEISTRDNPTAADALGASRTRDVESSRTGLEYLAKETGGKFAHDQNYLDAPIKKLLQAERGFYLVAYEPDEDTFKGKNFNKIDVKVNRPGVSVSSRSGFFGVTDETAKSKKKTGDSELYEAIVAPIPRPGLSLQLSANYASTGSGADIVRAMFHLDGSEITFSDEPGGLKKAVLDVVAVTLDEKNQVVDEFTRTHVFKFGAAGLPIVLKNGLTYSTDVPIKKPGSYNFRVAVRDVNGNHLGSAAQLIEIPDLKKGGTILSGLTVTGVDANGKFDVPGPVSVENAISVPKTQAVPSVRRFNRGAVVAYLYSLYNAAKDPATGKADLTIQVNLFHNGTLIMEGKPQKAEIQDQADWSRINDYGYLRLSPNSEAGDYALQILIKDLASKTKDKVISQWVDFEIVE